MSETTQTDAQVIVDTAFQAASPHALNAGDVVGVVVPHGMGHQVVDLEKQLGNPRRTRGTVTLHDPGSFADYVNRHKTDATQWYVDLDARRFAAVVNDHTGDVAGWRDHRATVELRHTPEWVAWAGFDRKLVTQESFAEHIDQNRPDIFDPPAADLLELVQTFQATNNATFKRATRLDNGEIQVTFNEDIEARGGRDGQMTIPDTFTLQLAPFMGFETVELTAQLRYRIRDGHLAIGYVLLRADRVVHDAIESIVESVQTATGIQPLWGVAPTPVQG